MQMTDEELDEALKYIIPADTSLLQPSLSEIHLQYDRELSERIGADGVLEEGDAYDPDREEVRSLRLDGMDIETISDKTGIAKEQVTEYCHELGLPAEGSCRLFMIEGDLSAKPQPLKCRNCGAPLPPGRRKFCCDGCHQEHKYEERNSRGGKTAVCKYCGAEFTEWKSKNRKYCSRECYLADRYGHDTGENIGELEENRMEVRRRK